MLRVEDCVGMINIYIYEIFELSCGPLTKANQMFIFSVSSNSRCIAYKNFVSLDLVNDNL